MGTVGGGQVNLGQRVGGEDGCKGGVGDDGKRVGDEGRGVAGEGGVGGELDQRAGVGFALGGRDQGEVFEEEVNQAATGKGRVLIGGVGFAGQDLGAGKGGRGEGFGGGFRGGDGAEGGRGGLRLGRAGGGVERWGGPVTQRVTQARVGGDGACGLHPVADHAVPAFVAGAGFARGADDQPAFGAGHRDIEQAAAFAVLRGLTVIAGLLEERWQAGGGAGPVGVVASGEECVAGGGFAFGGVGKDDDRRLQPFGAVDGHHADAVFGGVHLAFDFQIVSAHPFNKAGERGDFGGFIGERLGEKGVDAVLGLWPKPGEKAASAVVAGQQAVDQVIGAQEVGLLAQVVEDRERVRVGPVAQRLPQIALAGLGEGVELLFGPAEKRGAEGAGERKVILGQGEEAEERADILDGEFGTDAKTVSPGNGQALGFQRADDGREEV